jgi:hypothetical protein
MFSFGLRFFKSYCWASRKSVGKNIINCTEYVYFKKLKTKAKNGITQSAAGENSSVLGNIE